MDEITQVLFSAAVLLELIYVVLFVLTIKLPGFRFWPPPKVRSWQFFFSWLAAGLVVVSFLFIGLLDFDSFVLSPLRQRLPFAIIIFVMGSLIGSWAFFAFGLKNTIGVEDKLVTGGPYRFTRNPQYIGDTLNIIGYMVLTNSWMIWIIAVLGVILNLLAPYTEEPWLEERYGERYREYKRRVPRFIGKIRKENVRPDPE
ncbi:methyltransferase family protein [Chloroflexota bacterium]